MTLALVAAVAANGVIGRDGTMPWHVPEDLAHFRAHTHGHPVIMGRRTWESFPERFRPLPGRTNVVVTSRSEDPGLQADPREDGTAVIAVSSWREAVRAGAEAPGGEHLWVIGGARLLEDAMPELEHAVVTVIEVDEPGDTRAPRLETPWRLERRDEDRLSRTGLRWHVEHWRR